MAALRARAKSIHRGVPRSPALIAAVLLGIATAACTGGNETAEQPLRVDLVGSAGVDPLPLAVRAATQSGLLGFDSRGEVVPQLASSWRVVDGGASVIFRLRARSVPGGTTVAADDVVAAFRRLAQRPDAASRALLGFIAGGDVAPASRLGIDSPVAAVVEVRAAGVLPGLLPVLAQPQLAVGRDAGPMRVVDPAASPLRLARRPGASAPAAITLTSSDDASGAIARFAHGRSDLVIATGLAGFDDARLLAASNALRVEPAWGVYGYLINPHGTFADPRVRQALAMAIDRDDLGSRLFGVALTPVLGLVPPLPTAPAPALPAWAIEAPAARLDLARQLLAAAGFTAAHPLTVTISLPDGHEHAAVAAEVASDWMRVGVRTQTAVRTPAAHARAVAARSFELALVERTSPLATPLAFLAPFSCPRGAYCNAAADELLAAARTARDVPAAMTTLASAEAAMVADTPLIALFAPVRWALVGPRVGGWSGNTAGQHPLAALSIGKRTLTAR